MRCFLEVTAAIARLLSKPDSGGRNDPAEVPETSRGDGDG
jgi:hypothetical protein